jgi:hypothetical protein
MRDSAAILNRYHIGCALLNPNDELVDLLRNTPGWNARYTDATAALLVQAPKASSN